MFENIHRALEIFMHCKNIVHEVFENVRTIQKTSMTLKSDLVFQKYVYNFLIFLHNVLKCLHV